MIFNIRGTSGSGKTTLIRHFFNLCDAIEVIQPANSKKPKGYKCRYLGCTFFVVGSYESVCGGCDTISTQDEIGQLVEDFSIEGHVLFEGLFASHIYERYAEMARRDPDNFVFLMLETPFETCIDHIKKRREERGDSSALKESVYINAKRTYDATYRIRNKLTSERLLWEELPLNNRYKLFEDILEFYTC